MFREVTIVIVYEYPDVNWNAVPESEQLVPHCGGLVPVPIVKYNVPTLFTAIEPGWL